MEETLSHPWFAEFKQVHKSRVGDHKDANTGLDNKFEAFTLTDGPNSPSMTQDLEELEKQNKAAD